MDSSSVLPEGDDVRGIEDHISFCIEGMEIGSEIGSHRWAAMCSVPTICDWVEEFPDTTTIPDDATCLEHERVFRLSSTPRELGDPLLLQKDFVVAHQGSSGATAFSGRRLPLREYLDSIKTELTALSGLSKPLIFSEAFKLLESDFTQMLKAECNMSAHRKFVEAVKEYIWIAAKLHGWPIAKPGWVNSICFGVFAEAVLKFNTMDISEVGVENEDSVMKLKLEITDIFWRVMDEGVTFLQEEAEAEDSIIQEAILFLIDRENLLCILEEWTASAQLRGMRNSQSHPFGVGASPEIRMAAMEYYNVILGQDFTKEFRHIAQLGRLKLKKLPKPLVKVKVRNNDDFIALAKRKTA